MRDLTAFEPTNRRNGRLIGRHWTYTGNVKLNDVEKLCLWDCRTLDESIFFLYERAFLVAFWDYKFFVGLYFLNYTNENLYANIVPSYLFVPWYKHCFLLANMRIFLFLIFPELTRKCISWCRNFIIKDLNFF